MTVLASYACMLVDGLLWCVVLRYHHGKGGSVPQGKLVAIDPLPHLESQKVHVTT